MLHVERPYSLRVGKATENKCENYWKRKLGIKGRRMIYPSLPRKQRLIFHFSYDIAWEITNVCMQPEFLIFVRTDDVLVPDRLLKGRFANQNFRILP